MFMKFFPFVLVLRLFFFLSKFHFFFITYDLVSGVKIIYEENFILLPSTCIYTA